MAKPVVNEVEVPVPVVQYAAIDTGCKNSFGHAVPCFQEGEARRKRSADEEAAEAAPAVASVLPYHLGLGYHGLGYAGLGYGAYAYGKRSADAEPEADAYYAAYGAYPYAGLGYGYAGLGYGYGLGLGAYGAYGAYYG